MPDQLTKTRAEYAKQYGVKPRTITRWIAKGYPLDREDKIAELVGGQKNSKPIPEPESFSGDALCRAVLDEMHAVCMGRIRTCAVIDKAKHRNKKAVLAALDRLGDCINEVFTLSGVREYEAREYGDHWD